MLAASAYCHDCYCKSKYSFALSGGANGGSNPYSLQKIAQPDFEENSLAAPDVSTQTEQHIEINEPYSSEQQKVNWKIIILELQEYIDKIDIDCVRVVTDVDDDIILKGKEMIKEIELIMDTVET